ncbi:type II secretion system F family protein [Intrasporangium flavum]|uniref:type II secretion system F family protein n=1 Tax=Intrasporangium flavum TaxID=1428657 RepID=UPI000970016D|nr:type II secretion system F family protein [Intrasporangium flavum]
MSVVGGASIWASVPLSTAGLTVGVLVALVALAWPRRRAVRAARSRDALALGPSCSAADSSPPEPGGRREAMARLWRADPVQLVREWRLRRRSDDLLAGALDLLSGIGAGLEAGLPPVRAVELAATSVVGADALAHVSRAGAGAATPPAPGSLPAVAGLAGDLVRAGRLVRPASAVWDDWALKSGSDELAFVAAAWRLSERTGAPLAAAVERAARGLRDVRRRRGRVAAAVAGPRATVSVLTALPLAGPLLGMACGVDPRTLYLGSPLSTAAVVLGAGLAVLGRWWCARMVRAVAS